jgi:hypothetical protein
MISRATETIRPVFGESTKETVKAIRAGNAGCLRCTCGDFSSCAFYFSHARLRVRMSRPAFPAPSVFGGTTTIHNSGVRRHEEAKVCLLFQPVIPGRASARAMVRNCAPENPPLPTLLWHHGFRDQPCGLPQNDGRRGGTAPLRNAEAMEAAK